MRSPPIVRALRVLARTPPNFFSIAFGLAGLAVVWQLMASYYGSPAAVGDALFIASAAVWLVLTVGAIARLLERPRAVLGELRDPVLSPFWALPWIVGMLLGLGLEPHAHAAGKALFIVFLIAALLYGGWVTGQWFLVDLDRSKAHPGYFLPTVASGLLGGECAGDMGMHALGWLCFGMGMISWLMLGSLIINRLFFTAMLPAALVPTLAIEVAPPAVAGSAYFALHGPTPDVFAYGLAGYAVLMVLVQVRLLPLYARLRFTPAFWAFAFSWTAVALLAQLWLRSERPAGEVVYAALAAGAVSLLTAAIAARSLLAIARGEFLPQPSAAPTSVPAPDAAILVRQADPAPENARSVAREHPHRSRQRRPGPLRHQWGNVMHTIVSSSGYRETLRSLLDAIADRGLTVFAQLDHASAAREIGMELADEVVLVFGNPRAGTPLMQEDPRIGIELPLRLLVWDDGNQTIVGYNDPRDLANLYGITRQAATLDVMSSLLAEIAYEAAAKADPGSG